MSRYTGPRVKVMRALGIDLPGLSTKTRERRPYPPGQHGQRRKKITEYGKRLQEKQKLRLNYGLSDSQLRRLFDESHRAKANTGDKLIELLERRLDNVIFRAGFARSIPAARQLVTHGHVLVNGKRVDRASFRVDIGETISIRPKSKDAQPVVDGLAHARDYRSGWLEVDVDTRAAKIVGTPEPDSILFPLEIQLVIEFFAQGG